MTLLVALMAVRSFVIVTPETPKDAGAAAALNGQLRQLIRSHRDETFRVLDLGRFLRGAPATHIAPRKKATTLLQQARQAYGELDVEGAVAKLREALGEVEQGLASRKGAGTWLSIRLELGIRLWELDNKEGELLVAKTLAFAPKHPLPPGELSEAMSTKIDAMRSGKKGTETIHFEAPIPVRIEVGAQHCVTPCTISGLPDTDVPWRGKAPGIEALGGLAAAGSRQRLEPKPIPGRAELVAQLQPLWTLSPKEADSLLAVTKAKLPAPHLVWVQVGAERLAMLRGQMVPVASLFYRGSRAATAVDSDAKILAWIHEAFAESAKVGAAVSPPGAWNRLGAWWEKNHPRLPALSMPSISRRTLIISGVTVTSAAAVVGVAYLVHQSRQPQASYDPVLGF